MCALRQVYKISVGVARRTLHTRSRTTQAEALKHPNFQLQLQQFATKTQTAVLRNNNNYTCICRRLHCSKPVVSDANLPRISQETHKYLLLPE